MTRLVLTLALRDLLRQRLQLICHLAMIMGIVVPLLTVLGARNGAVTSLLDELRSDPALLRIETTENAPISQAQAAAIARLPGVDFVVLKSRSQSDFVRVRAQSGSRIRNARLMASGPGDPILGDLPSPGPGEVAISADLARLLQDDANQLIAAGARIEFATDAPGRTQQARLQMAVAAVVPAARLTGQAILAPPELLDMFEAFHDGYAVPELGVTDGQSPKGRLPVYEGLRLGVGLMSDVAPTRIAVEALLDRNTSSADQRIAGATRMIGYLDNAFRLIAAVGFAGVAAALIVSMISDVAQRKRALATLALLGCDRRYLMLFPVAQTVVIVLAGLGLALLVFLPAAAVAERILDPSGSATTAYVHLTFGNLLAVTGCAGLIALVASYLAGRQILLIDPALILREAV